jgi:hypothetical protein
MKTTGVVPVPPIVCGERRSDCTTGEPPGCVALSVNVTDAAPDAGGTVKLLLNPPRTGPNAPATDEAPTVTTVDVDAGSGALVGGLGEMLPGPVDVVHCAKTTLRTHSAPKPNTEIHERRRLRTSGRVSSSGMLASVRSPARRR